MSQRTALTTVSVTGVAIADYDTALMTLTIEGRGQTGPEAKADARPAIDAANAAIKALEDDGVHVARDEMTADFSVNAETEYDHQTRRQNRVGYLATYALSFKTESVDRASEIFDRLSSLEGVQVGSPDFRVKELAALHREAFKDAKAKADRRFADECEALGLQADRYEIMSYTTRYDESESAGARPMRAMAAAASLESAGGGAAPVEIKAGKSTVRVTLSANYAVKGG